MREIGLRLAFLLLTIALPAVSANAQVTLELASGTLRIEPRSGQADGVVKVTFAGTDPATVTLRASPLAQGEAYAFVRFNDSHADNIVVDPKGMNCQPKAQCQIAFTVEGAWKSGTYQGTISAASPSATLASIPLGAVRTAPAFQPVLSSENLHGDRLVVDATTKQEFLLTVRDPAGAMPGEFVLTGTAGDGSSCNPLLFSPSRFHLEPEAGQAVIASVQPCVPAGQHFLALRVASATDKTAGVDTVVEVTRNAPPARRMVSLLIWVVLGSVVSVMLNNIFPVSRLRTSLRATLRQVNAILRDSGQAGAALVDGLAAESRRIDLSLKQIHFFSAGKVNDIQAAQAAVAALHAAAILARRIGQTRSAADSATLPIVTHAAIRQKLRDAEDALRAGDTQAASDRLAEAQSKQTEAQNDVQQTALAANLGKQLTKMMTERGRLVPAARQQAAPAGSAPVSAQLVQDPARNPRIRDLISQLAQDMDGVSGLDPRDVLDVERDLYIADIWTEYVEDKLRADPARFGELAASLLDLLMRNPKSDQVQTLLDLLRAETTPREIAMSLARGEGWVECDPRPRALQSVDIAFTFTHPALRTVSAASRLLTYDWDTGDGTTPPPDVGRFSHYFKAPRPRLRFWKTVRRSYDVTLAVRVPFTAVTDSFGFATVITPRMTAADRWRAEPMEIASFFISAAIAVATAFGTQFGGGVPNEITWSAGFSAFMLGFGLDQLRDTISPGTAAVTSPAPPPPAAAPAPAHPAT